MGNKYIELYTLLSEIKSLSINRYYGLVSSYGSNLVNKVIDDMIVEDDNNIVKFEFYIADGLYCDSKDMDSFGYYLKDLSMISMLTNVEIKILAQRNSKIVSRMNEICDLICDGEIKNKKNTSGFGSNYITSIIDKVDYVMSLGASNGITKKLGSLGIGGVTGGTKMATGGVLRKGQIGFLEGDGAEAVVPLDQNAKWINATARDMKKALEGQGVITSAGGKIVNYNFTQNNTSPKPLNRLEIYRQTQNQFNYYMGV